MPRAPRFWGPRAYSFRIFLNCFCTSARGPKSAEPNDGKQRGLPKSLVPKSKFPNLTKSKRHRGAPKLKIPRHEKSAVPREAMEGRAFNAFTPSLLPQPIVGKL